MRGNVLVSRFLAGFRAVVMESRGFTGEYFQRNSIKSPVQKGYLITRYPSCRHVKRQIKPRRDCPPPSDVRSFIVDGNALTVARRDLDCMSEGNYQQLTIR